MRRALMLLSFATAVVWLPPGHARAQSEVPAGGDPVVAIVGATEIHRSELETARQALPQQYRQLPLDAIYEPLLARIIDQKLLAEEAERRKLADSPEVAEALARAREQVLQQQLIEQAIAEGTTAERLEQVYGQMSTQPGFAEEEVHAHHILVDSEDKAKGLIQELSGGADFAELAKANSTDPSAASNAGDLGFFTRATMVEPFAEAAFAIEPGEVGAQPVQTQFGWHVIKVDERRTKVPTFEEKEPEIREQVAREIVTALLDDLRGKAQIQRFAPDGEPLEN